MSYDIDAVYDDGVFRPLEPIAIPNGERVRLHVVDRNGERSGTRDTMSQLQAKRRAELDELRRIMAELPIESPDDGFSCEDHDKLLYGKP